MATDRDTGGFFVFFSAGGLFLPVRTEVESKGVF